MDNLERFLFKNVNVIDKDGKEYKNYFVDTYTTAADNDDTEESIGIVPSETAKTGYELYLSEIKSIELA